MEVALERDRPSASTFHQRRASCATNFKSDSPFSRKTTTSHRRTKSKQEITKPSEKLGSVSFSEKCPSDRSFRRKRRSSSFNKTDFSVQPHESVKRDHEIEVVQEKVQPHDHDKRMEIKTQSHESDKRDHEIEVLSDKAQHSGFDKLDHKIDELNRRLDQLRSENLKRHDLVDRRLQVIIFGQI